MSSVSAIRGPSQADIGEAEWNARVDLAAAHHLCVLYGWGNLNLNHISMRVPGEPDYFLLKPHSLLFEEVKASNLRKIPLAGPQLDEFQDVNKAGFTIHAGLLRAKPQLNCFLHIHSKPGMAFSAHSRGLLPMTQGSMRFYKRLAYHDYEGIATDMDEGARLSRDLGDMKAMILRNHGLLTAGRDVCEAVTLMRYLVTACETQLMLEATGVDIIIPPPEVCEHTARQWDYSDNHLAASRWPAYLRYLDRHDTSYRD